MSSEKRATGAAGAAGQPEPQHDRRRHGEGGDGAEQRHEPGAGPRAGGRGPADGDGTAASPLSAAANSAAVAKRSAGSLDSAVRTALSAARQPLRQRRRVGRRLKGDAATIAVHRPAATAPGPALRGDARRRSPPSRWRRVSCSALRLARPARRAGRASAGSSPTCGSTSPASPASGARDRAQRIPHGVRHPAGETAPAGAVEDGDLEAQAPAARSAGRRLRSSHPTAAQLSFVAGRGSCVKVVTGGTPVLGGRRCPVRAAERLARSTAGRWYTGGDSR